MSVQLLPAFTYRLGLNHNVLSDHLGIRVQYRYVKYKSPDFHHFLSTPRRCGERWNRALASTTASSAGLEIAGRGELRSERRGARAKQEGEALQRGVLEDSKKRPMFLVPVLENGEG